MPDLRTTAARRADGARTPSTRRRAGTTVLAVLVTGALAACSSDGEDLDTTPGGQVAYACALAEQIGDEHPAPEDWGTAIGADAEPGAVAASALAALLGGATGFAHPDHPELAEPAVGIVRSVQRMDLDGIEDGLADVRAACVDVDGTAPEDLGQAGQVAYACALARSVTDERGEVSTWGGILEDPAWTETMAAAALVGAFTGGPVPGAEAVGDALADVVTGVSRADAEQVQSGLEDLVGSCPS